MLTWMCDITVYFLPLVLYLFQDIHSVCNLQSTVHMEFVSLYFHFIFLVYYLLSCN